MPLQKDAECTTAAIAEIVRAQQLLCQRLATAGLANRDDVRLATEQYLVTQQEAVNRLQCLIRRYEREAPSFPRSELESILVTLKRMGVELTDKAVRGGSFKLDSRVFSHFKPTKAMKGTTDD